jgi:ATP-dependent Clp protease ATP-binding subunit ClpA
MTKKTYRAVCPEIEKVLLVKGFSLDDEKRLYDSIKDKILQAEENIDVFDYKKFIIQKFLVNAKDFLKSLPKDEEESSAIINIVYESIVRIYPPYSLEFICQDINTDIFFKDIKGKLGGKKLAEKLKNLNSLTDINNSENTIMVSSLEDIKRIESYFKENIIGQKDAIAAVVKAMKLMASGLSKHCSFLFVGPTGVGKTQLAKLLGGSFSGNFFKVNCAEYASAHEYAKLIGSPPGYIGHSEKSLLAEKAEESNQWVFLFDEIEKAHHKLYDFLLSLLDDGTCTDNLGKTLDFSESIFIFTSNQGMKDIKRSSVGFDRIEQSKKDPINHEVITTSIKNHFSPEFLNRIDDIVLFKSLTKTEVKEIAKLQLEDLPIIQTNALLDFIVENGYSNEYGARNIARFIKNNITVKIADAVLGKRVPKVDGDMYTPRIVKGELTIVNTKKYKEASA